MAGTYLAVKPDGFAVADIQKIQRAVKFANPIPREKLHCTLMYSKNTQGVDYVPSPNIEYSAEVIGCEVMGEVGSPWRAIALKLHCPALERRFNFAKTKGLVHSYPDFKPHISLAYGDDVEGYLIDLKKYLETSKQITLVLGSEYSEELVDE
jgi:hypothetical protein